MWWLVACAPPVPTARVDSLALVGLGWEQVDARLDLVVTNPYPVDVPITGLRWSVQAGGRPLVAGSSAQRVVIAAGSDSPLPIPLTLRYADLAGLTGAVAAHAEVAVDVETPVRPVTLDLTYDTVLPELSAPSVELVSLTPSWDGAMGHLALVVGVDLPAWVGTGTLSWTVSADDRLLGQGAATLGADRHLAVDVGVDPMAVASTSWDTWRGRVRSVHFEASGRVETGYGVLPLEVTRDLVLQQPPADAPGG